MIPKFPDFKKLEIIDKEDIEKITSQFPPYSDFNFVSMWSWNTEEKFMISNLNDNLVVMFLDYITNKPFYSFIGKNDLQKTVETLINLSEQKGLEPILKLIPEECIVELGANNPNIEYEIEVDRNNFDYMLDNFATSALLGHAYYDKRRHINQFLKYYPSVVTRFTSLRDEAKSSQIIDLFSLWEESRDKKNTKHEKDAITRLINSDCEFSLVNVSLWDYQKMIGYSIIENRKSYSMGHFMKGDRSYKNIYDVLYYQISRYLSGINCQYLNYEQDLNIESLRVAKSSWKPAYFLKKYTISK